jgi:transcription elongation factor Elf1
VTTNVTNHTRAGANGKRIECPHCGRATTVCHFSWSAMKCQGCGAFPEKLEWLLAPATNRVAAAIDALIDARNVANVAQQRYSDTTAGVGAESLGKLGRATRQEVSDALYEATYELVNRIDNLIGRVEFQNLMMGCSDE